MQSKGRLKWFAVPIYLRSSEPVGDETLLEEAIHLFRALSEAQAAKKAMRVARGLEHKYLNVYEREVTWTIDEIGDPWELVDRLGDGAEIFPRFMTKSAREAIREIPERTNRRGRRQHADGSLAAAGSGGGVRVGRAGGPGPSRKR